MNGEKREIPSAKKRVRTDRNLTTKNEKKRKNGRGGPAQKYLRESKKRTPEQKERGTKCPNKKKLATARVASAWARELQFEKKKIKGKFSGPKTGRSKGLR